MNGTINGMRNSVKWGRVFALILAIGTFLTVLIFRSSHTHAEHFYYLVTEPVPPLYYGSQWGFHSKVVAERDVNTSIGGESFSTQILDSSDVGSLEGQIDPTALRSTGTIMKGDLYISFWAWGKEEPEEARTVRVRIAPDNPAIRPDTVSITVLPGYLRLLPSARSMMFGEGLTLRVEKRVFEHPAFSRYDTTHPGPVPSSGNGFDGNMSGVRIDSDEVLTYSVAYNGKGASGRAWVEFYPPDASGWYHVLRSKSDSIEIIADQPFGPDSLTLGILVTAEEANPPTQRGKGQFSRIPSNATSMFTLKVYWPKTLAASALENKIARPSMQH